MCGLILILIVIKFPTIVDVFVMLDTVDSQQTVWGMDFHLECLKNVKGPWQ